MSALLGFFHIYFLQVSCLETVASYNSVPSVSGFDVEAVSITLIGACKRMFSSWSLPSFGGIIPYIVVLLLLMVLLLIFHSLLPFSQTIHNLGYLHLLLFRLWKLLDSAFFISINSPSLFRNLKIWLWWLILLVILLFHLFLFLLLMPLFLLFLFFLTLKYQTFFTIFQIRLYIFHINSFYL